MKPIVHGLAGKYEGRITFLYADISDSAGADARRRLGYRSTPHFVLLSPDGRRIADSTGVIDAAAFEKWLTSHLLAGAAAAPRP